MDYEKLVAELASDPVGMGYASMTDAQVSAAIAASTRPTRKLVPLWEVKKRLIETGAWLAIVQYASSGENAQVKEVAALTCAYIDDTRFDNLDVDLPSTQQMLGVLQQAGLITAQMASEIDALADTWTTRAAQLGLGSVGDGHVHSAREMMQ
jgi:hypothetical protein